MKIIIFLVNKINMVGYNMGITSLIYVITFFILIIVLLVSFSVLKNEKAIDRLFEHCGIKCKKNDKKE